MEGDLIRKLFFAAGIVVLLTGVLIAVGVWLERYRR